MHFNDIINAVINGFAEFRFQDFIDILIIAFLIYKVISITTDTRSYQLLKGIGILLLAMMLSTVFNLYTVNYLLNTLLVSGIVVVVVLFQPELRRALAHIGRFKFNFITKDKEISNEIVKEIVTAVMNLSKRKVGALIVIERETKLDDYFATGTILDAQVSSPLLENIFEPKTPLHDGAVIIRDGRIHVAACVLPLFSDANISKELGTRHRAALGVSTVADAFTIVVSEETGTVSYTESGKIVRYVDRVTMSDLLENIFSQPDDRAFSFLSARRKNNGKEKNG